MVLSLVDFEPSYKSLVSAAAFITHVITLEVLLGTYWECSIDVLIKWKDTQFYQICWLGCEDCNPVGLSFGFIFTILACAINTKPDMQHCDMNELIVTHLVQEGFVNM